jgi:hypothetical protein
MRPKFAVTLRADHGRRAVLDDVADEAPGGLFGTHPLPQLAGSHVEQFDGDAVFLFETLDRGDVERRAEKRGVERELAFPLRRGDEVWIASLLRRRAQ